MIFEMWPFDRKKAAKSHIFLFSAHSGLFMHRKINCLNVNLQVVNEVGPLSACANCISNPTLYFAQPKLNWRD